MTEGNSPGEDKAWEILAIRNPEEVCRAASVAYDATAGIYRVTSFNMEVAIDVKNRGIMSSAPGSEVLLKRLGYFFKLSVLWYLVSAKDIDCTGRPVKLDHVKGGDAFTRGSHVLPLDGIVNKYGKNKAGFIEKGKQLGGVLVKNGDVSIRFSPLPRVPVTLSLWLEDEEFPAGVDLLFDSTCELQIPTDIIWSIAMVTALIIL
jgi:Domain of unknown function (DUF3786)